MGTNAFFVQSSIRLLAATSWVSVFLFGLYILAFYFKNAYTGQMAEWNNILPGLYEAGGNTGNIGIGLHFATGGIILILGCVQLLDFIRRKYLPLHKAIGYVYITSSFLAAIGGLSFVLVRGTIGGTVMDIGFALYGILMLVCSVNTVRYALGNNLPSHRAWAIRLFALAIGSWLYRMDYGFWFLFAGKLGHTSEFSGWFDYFMDFWFYLPNLFLAEIFIRRNVLDQIRNTWVTVFTSLVLLTASFFIVVGTYYFTLYYWGPAILTWFN